MKKMPRRILRWRRGQSSVEFALLTPIVFFLLYLIFQGYKLNTRSSLQAQGQHQNKLTKLDHGNGSFELDGINIAPGTSGGPLLPLTPSTRLTEQLLNQGAQLLAQLGLNAAISEFNFLDGKTYFSGASRGAIEAAGGSYINSGFKTIDWDSVMWGAAAGALQSQEATEDFQGQDFLGSSSKEALGSALQSGAVAYAKSQGDVKAAITGSVSGLFGSDTVKAMEFSNNEILMGAAKGAIQSTVAGAMEGKVDFKTVAVATGLGAFNTKAVASKIPFSNGVSDPRQSASFQALNSGLSAAISGGSAKETLYAAASGAFYSQQSIKTIAGDSALKASLASGAYGATIGLIQGQSLQAVGTSTIQGIATGLAIRQTTKAQEALLKRSESFKTKQDATDAYNDRSYQLEFINAIAQDLEEQKSMDAIEDATINIFTGGLWG